MVKNNSNGNFRVPYALAVFGKEEISAVSGVMQTPMIVPGPKVKEFEQEIAKLFGKRFGVMVNSGSSANLIAFELLKLPPGSEVITPVLTFGTTLSPMIQKGLVPAFCDVVLGSYQIDIDQVESMITNKTKAILVPSLIGNIPDFQLLRKVADQYKLWLIEDSCDTLGATIDGVPTGTYTDISTTSFYASHVITTGGHGGMVSFNEESWWERAKTLVGWGRSSAKNETEAIESRFNIQVDGIPYDSKFVFDEIGYNFQSTDLDAAFGLAQLEKLDEFSQIRKDNFKNLFEFFVKYDQFFHLPIQDPRVDTPWLAFPIIVKKHAPFTRRDLAVYLEQHDVQTRPLFTGNALRQPAFKHLKSRKRQQGYPVADLVMEGSLVIGCHQGMEAKHINRMKEVFETFLSKF